VLRLALLAFVSLFLAGSVPTAEARPVAKKSAKAKAKPPAKKKAVAKKAKPTKRKKKAVKKKRKSDDDEKPSEPRRPMP
jgi:hypothetical protein